MGISLVVDRVDRIGAGEDAGLRFGEVGAVEVGLLTGVGDVGLDRRALLVGGDLGHQQVFGGKDAVGGAEKGVGAGW